VTGPKILTLPPPWSDYYIFDDLNCFEIQSGSNLLLVHFNAISVKANLDKIILALAQLKQRP